MDPIIQAATNKPGNLDYYSKQGTAINTVKNPFPTIKLPEKTTTNSIANSLSSIGNSILQYAGGAYDANLQGLKSAYDAMYFSAAEAAKNREFQERIYNQTSAYNAAEAAKNREWQERMSNTAYQRAMDDMRKAGLNPILAYTQGGASTPAGTSATIGTLTGSQGTGYTYQAQQENTDALKILGVLANGGFGLIGQLVNSAIDAIKKLIK